MYMSLSPKAMIIIGISKKGLYKAITHVNSLGPSAADLAVTCTVWRISVHSLQIAVHGGTVLYRIYMVGAG